MAELEDDGFNEDVFKALDEAPVIPPVVEPVVPPVEPPKEELKPDDKKEELDGVKPPEVQPPVEDKKPEEGVEPPKAPETPSVAPEAPSPLTKDDVTSVISDLLEKERTSGKELDTTAQEVLEAYYPGGLSTTLVDEKSGKELRTPADVVEASGNTMSTEEAAQWLMNEQYRLEKDVAKIKDDARVIAETTVNFKRDAVTALQKYEPLFKQYPQLQDKVYQKLMKQVKVDKDKGVILSAPDVMEHYDDFLEPYQLAYEHSTKQSATAPTPPVIPEPPKPSAEDRMDVQGDGGQTPVDDPNDFVQQVKKELGKGI